MHTSAGLCKLKSMGENLLRHGPVLTTCASGPAMIY